MNGQEHGTCGGNWSCIETYRRLDLGLTCWWFAGNEGREKFLNPKPDYIPGESSRTVQGLLEGKMNVYTTSLCGTQRLEVCTLNVCNSKFLGPK